MHIHPLLNDERAVLVYRSPVPDQPAWADFERVAQEALTLTQLEVLGNKVVFKPNCTVAERFQDGDCGVGTHPAFVGGLTRYVRAHGARPGGLYVVEDPRDTDDNEPRHWRGTGYLEMAAATGFKLRCPTDYSCVNVPVPHPLVHATRNVSRLVVAEDTVFINVPKLKTHNLGITTLSMKNLMGVDNVFDRHYCAQAMKELPAERRREDRPRAEWMDDELHQMWQEGLARRLVDLAQVAKPHLNVVEGVVGRDGTAFQHGRNYTLGLVVAGINMVAVDSVASYIMGFDPQQLIYLRVAAGAGLGCNDVSQLRVLTAAGPDLVPCADVASLRAQPPFRVIRNIIGEEAPRD
jgi:uncharacterized protein (DUF362 family)